MAKGNPFGQIRAKPFREALNMELAAAGEDHKALRQIAQGLIAKAIKGDVPAANILIERLEGKVPQAIIGGDENDPAIAVSLIERHIIDPRNTNSTSISTSTSTEPL